MLEKASSPELCLSQPSIPSLLSTSPRLCSPQVLSPHLTTSAGSLVPARETCLREQAWLKNSLMSGEMVFTLLKRMGTTWQQLQPSSSHCLLPSRHARAYLWEYTFLERSRWTRLLWDPCTRAPKSCQGGDVSHGQAAPEVLHSPGMEGPCARYSQHPKDSLCQPG